MSKEKAEGLEEESSILIWLTGFTFIAAMAAIFLFVPTEKTEGPIQRIMYLHIPSAWLSFFAFFIVFISSILFLSCHIFNSSEIFLSSSGLVATIIWV